MEDEFINLTFPNEKVALLTFKEITLTIPMVRSINKALDFLLEKEVQPLTLLTTSNHHKIYCAGLNFQIFI